MRTVRDEHGETWICLELPEVPVDQQADASVMQPPPVAVECNSGADRRILLVTPEWDDALDDDALLGVIRAAAR